MPQSTYPPPEQDPERAKILALATADDAAYAVSVKRIHGVDMPVFRFGPRNLRELYTSSLVYPDRDFIVYEDERYTFKEAWLRASAIATELARRGVRPGERVAIAMRNYPEFAFVYMAVTSIGAVAVALNGWWTGAELQYGLQDSGATWAFVDGERLQRLLTIRGELGGMKIVCCRHDGPLPPDVESLATWQEPWPRAVMPDVDVDPDADANILYTSGSTGRPKGAVTTHRAILSAVLSWEVAGVCGWYLGSDEPNKATVREWLTLGERAHTVLSNLGIAESMLVNVPLFHVTGLNVMLLASFRPGRKLVFMYKWNAEKALELIEREKITHLHGVPTMTWEILNSQALSKHKLDSLVSIGGGGAARPPEHVRQMSSKFPPAAVPAIGYGMTETSALGTGISGPDYVQRPSSSGRPMPPLMRIDIVDDHGDVVPIGETGEIRLFCASNMRCYWNKPVETAETLRDGWISTGDIGRIDQEGFLYITDRKKDIVIRGGENISCTEVEAALYEHPGVLEAAVYGQRDDRLGETLAAIIVARPEHRLSEEEIVRHLGTRLAAYKVPERIQFTREQLPRIASGKIDKHSLRKRVG